MPWFDEVVFADISNNLASGKGMKLLIAPPIRRPDYFIPTYGPIYFLIQSIFIQVFGLNIWLFRFVGFIGGFFSLVAFWSILKNEKINIKFSLLVLVFMMDPLFASSSHGGRMDLVALAIGLFSVLFYIKYNNTNYSRYMILSGVAMVLAAMTTPRILIPFSGFAIILVMKSFNSFKNFAIHVTYWLIPFCLIYYAWVLYAFSGIANYILFFKELSETFVGIGFNLPLQSYILYFTSFFSFCYFLVTNKIRDKKTNFFIIGLLGVVFYFLLVRDTGPYSIIILPFIYFFMFNLKKINRKIFNKLITVILIFNGLFFFSKSIFVFSSKKLRDLTEVEDYLSTMPENQKIVSDDIYFYSIKKSGHEFFMLDHYWGDYEREEFNRINHGYDYLLISENSLKKEFNSQIYFDKSELKLEKEFQIKQHEYIRQLENFLPIKISNSTSGKLYKRIK